jgi:hypothetical protein
MEREKLIEKVKAASKDGKITCSQALAVAREAKVSPAEVGEILNELKIKIHACQLGCFP